MWISRLSAVAALGLVLAGCGVFVKGLDAPDAARLVSAHADFTAPVTRLPLAPDIVDTGTGIDAGVLEGIWRYRGRDASGQPSRELTAKGRESWSDANGGLATPG